MRHLAPLPLLLTLAPAQGLAEKVDELCRPLLAGDVIAGCVVGVIDGDVELVRGIGRLSRAGDAVPDGDTLWEIGSISKVFTGLLLADAVERGRCRLEDPVQALLPEGVRMQAWREQPVLLWHLATHTSGLPRLPDLTGSDPANPYAHFTAAALFELLPDTRVQREPGTHYEYSNLATGLLGALLARRDGASSYDELLRRRITGPLRMNDTCVVLTPEQQPRLAPPHDGGGEPAQPWDLAALAGAGGIRSSMRDLLKFARLQLAPGASPLAKAVALSQQKHFDGRGVALGLGWHFARDGKTRWHSGETGGFHGWIGVVPGEGRAVCVLTNTATGTATVDQFGERILQHLYGIEVAPLAIEVPVTVEPAQLQRLVGRYRMAPAMELDVTLRGTGLYAQLTGQQALRLFPRSPTEFCYRAVEATITFELDGDTVTGLVLHQHGRHLKCRRLAAAPKPHEPARK
jgi:serine-type D-Ala-D-Ala carboxypeptidase/endopeptidase